MTILTISHVTRYSYRQPVSFGEHRIFVRPRESYDQHLIDAELKISPEPAELRWLQDVFGNSVAIATFDRAARELIVDSSVFDTRSISKTIPLQLAFDLGGTFAKRNRNMNSPLHLSEGVCDAKSTQRCCGCFVIELHLRLP